MKKILIFFLAAILIISTSCNKTSKDDLVELKIGVMPAVDSAPFFIAQERGYFDEAKIKVEIQVFNNAMDRQSALQTNSIDGAISDMVALITNVNSGFEVKATTMTDGMFPILVREDFEESEDITITIMEISVVNYLADMYLSQDYNLNKVYVNEIPARLEMLKAKNADMGVFPEPVATMGTLDGLTKRIYENTNGYCPDVLLFTQKALDEKEQAIYDFHRALDRAIEDIKKDNTIAIDILIEKMGFNPDIRELIDLPEYRLTRLPDEAYVQNLVNWTSDTIGKDIDLTAEDIFERKFAN